MIINFRYHVFTITAIFAALGIGILIGTSIIGNDGLLEEQKRIVNNISEEIDNLKKENNLLVDSINDLKTELSYKKNIEQKVYPLLLQDLIKDRKFFLLYDNNIKREKIDEIIYYFNLMKAEFELLDYQDFQESKIDDYSSFSYYVTWNISKPINDCFEGLNKNNSGKYFLEYQGDDVQGLIFNIVEGVINDK